MLIVVANSKNLVVSMKEVDANIVIHLFNSILLQVLVSLRTAYKLTLEDVYSVNLPLSFQMEVVPYLIAMSSKIAHVYNAKEAIISKKESSVN